MTELRTLATGLAMGESPRWHDDTLWVADWGAQELVTIDVAGTVRVVRSVRSFPFSIDWLPDERLVIVSSDDRQLVCVESDGSVRPYAELGSLMDRPWNEIVVDGRGNTYVNSIGFDMMGGEPVAPGIIAVVTPDGRARQVATDVMFPNGMAVTPDNETLIVAESYGNRLSAFDIDADGSLSNRRVWADLGDGVPDGICIDAEGAVWYADVPNRRCVRVAEGGEVLATVDADRGCFACMLGGADGRTLYIVAAQWPMSPDHAVRNGIVATFEAPAPHAGRP